MKIIYKYRIGPASLVVMPADAQLLHVGEQHIGHDHYALFVWALVDTENPIVHRKLHIIGTGWPDTDTYGVSPLHFVGTVQCRSGEVYHVFDGGPQP
jgi:hypothetical protein